MRLIKILGLAAIAALAVSAYIGASTASADTLCLADPAGEVCPKASLYTGPVEGLALGGAVLKAKTILGSVEVNCHSEFLAKYIEDKGDHKGLLYLINFVTFTECKGGCKEVKGGALLNSALILGLALEKHALIKSDEEVAPAALLVNCFGLGINCEFAGEPLLKIELEHLKADGVTLTETGKHNGLCPATGTWTAQYSVKSDEAGLLGDQLYFKGLKEA